MSPEALDLLQRVRARLLAGGGEYWTQGHMARDINGQGLEAADDPAACVWCLAGMVRVEASTYGLLGDASEALIQEISTREPSSGGMGDYNDSHSWGEVVALVDAVIAKERKLAEAS